MPTLDLITKSKYSINHLMTLFSFMSIVLPCADTYLRAACTQRPSRRTLSYENLDPLVERELAILLA